MRQQTGCGAGWRASGPARGTRIAALVRVAWGATMLVAPRQLVSGLGGRGTGTAVVTLRILGVRHLTQGTLTALYPSRPVLLAGAGVDVLHGLTTVLLAVLSSRQRLPALVETGLAVGWTATAVRGGRPGAGVGVPGRGFGA